MKKKTVKKETILSVLKDIRKLLQNNVPVVPIVAQELGGFDPKFPRLHTFFKEIFNLDIDYIPCPIKEGFDGYMIVPQGITEDMVFDAYDKKYGNTWKYYESITKEIKEQQKRPKTPYIFAYKDQIEPDTLNKSYDDFCNDGKNYMVPIEGLLVSLYRRWDKGDMLDVKGITRFHALDADGNAMDMCRDGNGQFDMGWCNHGFRRSDRGSRELFLNPSSATFIKDNL